MQSTRRIAVIGGGITGLAAAHRAVELARDSGRAVELTLFEAGPRLGGAVETQRVGDYLVEHGADSFITDKPWALDLCRRLGLEERLLPTDDAWRRSLVLRRGRPVPVPEGFVLLSPSLIWPVLRSPLFSPWGKLRMGLEWLVPRRRGGEDESLASFVRRRFGREALERLVQPLVGGIYTSDPEKLSLRATLPRFLRMEREHGSLLRAAWRRQGRADGEKRELGEEAGERGASGARYGLFVTLAGGLSELTAALEARVGAAATIRRNVRVTGLRNPGGASLFQEPAACPSPPVPSSQAQAGRWELSFGDGDHEPFDVVLLAVPAYHAAALLEPVDVRLAELLRGIEYASSAVVVTGHRLTDVSHPLDAFGLVVPAVERRDVLAVSFASRKFPGRAPEGRVLLRTFVGGAMQPHLFDRSDDELTELVLRELRDILGVAGPEDFALVARHGRAMPQYHVGHLDRVAEIERRASTLSGLALAGNAFHGVGLPDCVHSGEQAAERLADSS